MIIQLPVSSDPAQDFVTTLGEQTYEFYIRWNDRGSFWTMDVTDYNSQTKLISGMPLLLGCDLFSPYVLQNGSLIAYDTSGASQDANYDDLGTRVQMYWFDESEVQAALNGETVTT